MFLSCLTLMSWEKLLGIVEYLSGLGILYMTDCYAGGSILRQGKLGRSMYFVRSGFVDLVMDGAVVDTIAAGDYFGEVALLALPPTHELVKVSLLPPFPQVALLSLPPTHELVKVIHLPTPLPRPPPLQSHQPESLAARLTTSKVLAEKQKHFVRLAAFSLQNALTRICLSCSLVAALD